MNPRLVYNEENKEWILHTPVALNLRQLTNVVKFTFDVYKKRMNGTIGERRKNIEEALKTLKTENIKQVLMGPEPTFYYSGKY